MSRPLAEGKDKFKVDNCWFDSGDFVKETRILKLQKRVVVPRNFTKASVRRLHHQEPTMRYLGL